MKAEIIVSGSELLLGQSIDTNGPWIAQRLSEIGIDCHFKSVVGDNLENMAETFKTALSRADIVLCTGGLGPTQDDITKEALAKALEKKMIFDESLADIILDKFRRRNREMSRNNLRQAYYPEGAKVLKTHPGTAPGIQYDIEEDTKRSQVKTVFLMPGVPSEMKLMMREEILPMLLTRLPNPEKIYTKILRCWGKGESELAELLGDINDELDHKSNPKLSFLASGIEGIQVRFSSKNRNEAEAMKLIEPYENRAKALLGDLCFGEDEESMESTVATLLRQRNLTLGVFESFSEGMITARLNEKSASHDYFRGAWVESNQQSITPEIAQERLAKIAELSAADIVITVTAKPLNGEKADSNNTIELTLLLKHGERIREKVMIIPYFHHLSTVKFSVINLLNLLRLYLLRDLKI